jgi:choline dehydrogenase-like flavoprotein
VRTQFDAVIIGSGAGGAAVAHVLARAGKTVLVLEKGPLLLTQDLAATGFSDFKRDELLSSGAEKRIRIPGVANRGVAYYSSHVEPDINDEPHIYLGADGLDRATIEGYTAQVVGGGTQLYGGVSLRFTPLDFRLHSFNEGRTDLRDDPTDDIRREARDWPIGYDDLEPYYARAEALIGINGTRHNQNKPFAADHYQVPLSPNPISRHIERGMDALGMPRYRTPLAVITQDHGPSGRRAPADPASAKVGYVNRYGDPIGLKSNTWVALLHPIAALPNFELRPNCVVTQLEAAGGRIDRIRYLDPDNQLRTVDGTVVVVACSAIESVRLLQLSALNSSEFDRRINHNGLLGAYFLTHCFGGAAANVPGRHDKSQTLDSDWASDYCTTDAFLHEQRLWAGGVIYNNTSDSALPLALGRNYRSQDLDTIWQGFIADTELIGEQLVAFLDKNFGRGLSITFMANQVPLRTNRITLHPTVVDKWKRPVAYICKQWHAHDCALMSVFAAYSAAILVEGGATEGLASGGVFMAENALARCANHILGGARFGSDPRDSVLDPACRAWEFDNLYVADGAFMPTSGSANPTLTIQANALRVADCILKRL